LLTVNDCVTVVKKTQSADCPAAVRRLRVVVRVVVYALRWCKAVEASRQRNADAISQLTTSMLRRDSQPYCVTFISI